LIKRKSGSKEMMLDFKALAQEERPELERKLAEAYEAAKIMLLPRDEVDDRPVMIEFRAGTGGDEAAFCRRFVPHVSEALH